MVSHQKKRCGDLSLYRSNPREFERRRVVHFAKETAKRFREFFEFAHYCSWHFLNYLKLSAILAIKVGCQALDFRKLLKRK